MAKVGYKEIKAKVVSILENALADYADDVTVTVHYGSVAVSPNLCPCVLVYGAQITRAGRRIGGTRPRDSTITLKVDCVTHSIDSFEASDDALMELLDAVEEALDADATLGGLAVLSEAGDIDLDEDSSQGYFSGASITFRVEVRR